MEEWKLAYLAGLLDGEGSVLINKLHRSKRHHHNQTFSYHHHPRLVITNTNKMMIDWLVKNFSGNIVARKAYQKKYGGRLVYCQNYVGWRSIDLLHKLYPYLIIKKERANIMFEFEKTKTIPQHGKLKILINSDLWNERERLRLKIKGV